MTNEQQILITNWQLAASILMGIEYFLPTSLKERADNHFKNYLMGIEGRVDQTIFQGLKEIWDDKIKVLMGISFFSIFYLSLITVEALRNSGHLWAGLLISIVGLMFMVVGLYLVMVITLPRLLPISYGLPFRLGLFLMRVCPKGPIAATGLVCLFISFALRYAYLK
jgi:hypothetical protein